MLSATVQSCTNFSIIHHIVLNCEMQYRATLYFPFLLYACDVCIQCLSIC